MKVLNANYYEDRANQHPEELILEGHVLIEGKERLIVWFLPMEKDFTIPALDLVG